MVPMVVDVFIFQYLPALVHPSYRYCTFNQLSTKTIVSFPWILQIAWRIRHTIRLLSVLPVRAFAFNGCHCSWMF
jgi:hypothetical protein